MEDSTKATSMQDLHTVRVLILCALVILLEGFDLQAAGVSVPRLAPYFHLLPGQVGLFLTASAVGVFLAAALGGVLADRFGRRPVLVAGVTLFGLGSLATMLATGLGTLMVARFFTGLGLGAAMPVVIALASDHSPVEMKKRAVGFIYCAIPIGGLLSGVVMSMGVFGKSWQPVYVIGGIAPIVVAPLLALYIPKALPWATAKVKTDTGPKTNALSGLLGTGNAATTIYLWTATFATLLVMYLLLGWMPSLLGAMGLSKQDAQYTQMLYNLGASLGAATAGYLLDRKYLYSTPAVAYVGLAVFLALLGFGSLKFGAALVVTFGVGAAVTIGQAVLYAFAPLCYASSIRNTGVGATVAAGRLGTIAGPLLAGSLLGGGKTAAQVLIVLVPITLVAGLMSLLVVREIKRKEAKSAAPTIGAGSGPGATQTPEQRAPWGGDPLNAQPGNGGPQAPLNR
jgi:MFS transporter, AAHS family, 3-hydroxyphenylpropionic acid transporter